MSAQHNASPEQEQYRKMTATPIPRLIGGLAAPTIISMLVSAIYNLADTFFVSQLGTSAAGAVGIVFSLMAVIQAVGFTLGMGSGSVISRLLGQHKNEKADEIASSALFSAALFGLLITVFGLLFLGGLMRLLGATPTILPFAKDYARYILFGAPIMCMSFVMNNDLRAEGKAVLSMFGIGLGGLLNIALDPFFIFVLKMGISGAAVATLISQCVSFCILLSNYLLRRTVIRPGLRRISRKWRDYRLILVTGMPSFFRQGLASVATIGLNLSAAAYGDPAVAAMSIVARATMFVVSAMIGFGQGFQPVAGYNCGAGRFDRVKEAFQFCLKVGVIGLTVLAALGFAFAPQLMGAFRRDDPQVIAIGARAFRLQCLVLPLQAVIVISNMLFQSTGQAKPATLIAASRQGIFFLPAIFLLPRLFGLTGVQISQPIADLLTFAICIPILLWYFRSAGKAPEQ